MQRIGDARLEVRNITTQGLLHYQPLDWPCMVRQVQTQIADPT